MEKKFLKHAFFSPKHERECRGHAFRLINKDLHKNKHDPCRDAILSFGYFFKHTYYQILFLNTCLIYAVKKKKCNKRYTKKIVYYIIIIFDTLW